MHDHWERHATDWIRWARTPGHDIWYWRLNRPWFVELLPPPGRLTVDLGCGEGRLLRELAAMGHRVVGVDSAPTMARAAAQALGSDAGWWWPMPPGCHLPAGRLIWWWRSCPC
jgi:SAM-dependent methyltransferase